MQDTPDAVTVKVGVFRVSLCIVTNRTVNGREMEMQDERASSVNAPRGVQVQVQVVFPLSFIHRSETRIRSVECWLLYL
jgi:hypothetical protein